MRDGIGDEMRDEMELAAYLPFWGQLTPEQQALLTRTASLRTAQKGTVIHDGASDCLGLLVLRTGQLRAYILSEEGREVTLYRMFERDTCLLTAACVMRDIQFDIHIEVEKQAEIWIIPPKVYHGLMQQSAPVANYSNQLMATRFSEVMWLIEQIMWKSVDRRLAAFLLEESTLEGTTELNLTHERIANHMGTAREVVTRMLRYFQSEGMIAQRRGTVVLLDPARLARLRDG